MSIQAMAWAIEQQEVTDPHARFVLMCLAHAAGPTGENAFPSINRLCRDTGLSESTVRRCLRKLEKAAVIMRGNQAMVAAYIQRTDKRPVVYDLLIPRGVTQTPRRASGVSNDPERGVKPGGSGVSELDTQSSLKSVRKPKRVLQTDFKTENEKRAELERQLQTLIQRKKV